VRPVLVGVDGSDQSRRALSWALQYASERGAAVEAIMTVPRTDDTAETRAMVHQAAAELQAVVDEVVAAAASAPPVSSEVVEGDPAVVLVNASRNADLIVLGSHGMSRISNPALGSVSTACIRMGSCPVLVIPAGKPEPPDDSGDLAATGEGGPASAG
jgi:nucleotide-binding universal stress UspA family protein